MTNHDEILERIREITAQGKAYAIAHADEIEARITAAENESENKLAQILEEAKTAVKHSWSVYESFKNRISAAAVNSDQYETSIIRLTRILDI